ncbi:MAG: permease [Candidatus Peribacteraceae bacterium]|nr:permease [Candidatus Peribacteraceae bacterium]
MDHYQHNQSVDPCCATKQRKDWILIVTATIITIGYSASFLDLTGSAATFTESIVTLMNKMWWGMLLGIFFVGLMDHIPRELITSALGKGGTVNGILRACGASMLLDLCSHGILLVGMKLYERGASLGQVMAFLIASPWNSFSLTLILWALIGLKWTIAFLVLSMVIAIISGIIFDRFVSKGVLPANPNTSDIPEDFHFWSSLRAELKSASYTPGAVAHTLKSGLMGSTMILKWIFFGTVLAALLQTFVSADQFQTFFGPTLAGLGLTLIVATILEVCSEGSVPVAADLFTRAGAPGNSFAFLMTGISTDYTEILSIKETTKSWKISFFLPLVTVPQVVVLALILNQWMM